MDAEFEQAREGEGAPAGEPAAGPAGESAAGAAGDEARRRRRGRRGRGGGGGQPPPFRPQGQSPAFRPAAPGFRPQGQGFRPQGQGQFRPQGQGFRPQGQGFRPQGQGFRPQGPRFDQFRPQGQPVRPPGSEGEDEGSSQASELAAYERRQKQGQRPGGFRPGGWRQRAPGGQQGYEDVIRRVTGGPKQAAPSHEAGEPIGGPHAVLEAIRAGRTLRSLYVSQDRGVRTGVVSELIGEAQQRGIFVRYVDKLELARLSPVENHQGVVAIAEGRPGVDLDELLLHLGTLSGPALVLVLDQLRDPQNFGVLLRSAEGAGVDGVVIPRHRSVGITPAVAKTSAGASEHLLVADVPNLRQAIDALKEKGVWVVATDESGDLLYDEVDYRGPTALVIGNESEGIRRLVLEGCDQVVRIPMLGQVASLNAAAAGTILLYEAVRQRARDAAPSPTRTPRPAPPPGTPVEEVGFDDPNAPDDLYSDGALDGDEVPESELDTEARAEAEPESNTELESEADAESEAEADEQDSPIAPELDEAPPAPAKRTVKKAASKEPAGKEPAAKKAPAKRAAPRPKTKKAEE